MEAGLAKGDKELGEALFRYPNREPINAAHCKYVRAFRVWMGEVSYVVKEVLPPFISPKERRGLGKREAIQLGEQIWQFAQEHAELGVRTSMPLSMLVKRRDAESTPDEGNLSRVAGWYPYLVYKDEGLLDDELIFGLADDEAEAAVGTVANKLLEAECLLRDMLKSGLDCYSRGIDLHLGNWVNGWQVDHMPALMPGSDGRLMVAYPQPELAYIYKKALWRCYDPRGTAAVLACSAGFTRPEFWVEILTAIQDYAVLIRSEYSLLHKYWAYNPALWPFLHVPYARKRDIVLDLCKSDRRRVDPYTLRMLGIGARFLALNSNSDVCSSQDLHDLESMTSHLKPINIRQVRSHLLKMIGFSE